MAYQLHRAQRVSASLSEVTDFFERPENLEFLTPTFLRFKTHTPGPIEMKVGALIDYTIALYGVPMRWRTLIEEYVPSEHFIDVQLEGPYKRWHHLHTFRSIEGGTEIGDTVTYELPMGPLGAMAHSLFVKSQLETIFAYRYRVVAQKFGELG